MTKIRNRGKKSGNPTPYYNYKPEDLTCRICNEIYDKSSFSSNKLGELAKKLTDYNGCGPRYRTVCKNCAPKENTHILCANCLEKKPLSKYSKSQRSCNGNPRCISCIEKFIEEDVESSGAEYSDSGSTKINHSNFSDSSQQLSSLHDQFSTMVIKSPTSTLTKTDTKNPTVNYSQESYQLPNTDPILPLTPQISSLNHFSNAPEMDEVATPSIEYVKNDLDPICEALDQFPNLKYFLPTKISISKQILDKGLNNPNNQPDK